VREIYGRDVALVFLHYPLPNHPYAEPAARAAECADEQGGFEPFIDVAYARQDSLGKLPWTVLALAAGVRDTSRFGNCMSDTSRTFRRIRDGRDHGRNLDLAGTPTVIINGWRVSPTPYDSLIRVVENVRAGRKPFQNARK
jgi:protein-disulfide isomerase